MVDFKKWFDRYLTVFGLFLIIVAFIITYYVMAYLNDSSEKYTFIGFALTYAILAISIFFNITTNKKLDKIEKLLETIMK